MLSSKKRKVFSMEEKLRIIKKLREGESNVSIAKEFDITHSTVSTIWRNRQNIMDYFERKSLKKKRARNSVHTDIENALAIWITEQRAAGAPVNCRLLREKADAIAKEIGKIDFKCTNSWVQRFRGRHALTGIRVPRVIEKPMRTTREELLQYDWLAQDWLTQDRLSDEWLALCAGYTPEDIFNADEAGLFYNLTPEKTLRYKSKLKSCLYGKLCQSRLTLMVATNMTGTCKHQLLIIGSKKLSIKNHDCLPASYEYNNKSWMTSQIYEKWIYKWDQQLRLNDRKIVLLVDKSPVHPVIEGLYCIKIVHLPPYIPAVLQPMAQGVTISLKAHYRKLQMLHMLQCIENGGTGELTLFDAILMLSEAWDNVSQNTIAKSFKNAGFKDLSMISSSCHNQQFGITPIVKPISFGESIVNSERVTLVHLIQALGSSLTLTQLEEFIDVDNNLMVCDMVNNEEVQTGHKELGAVEQEKVKIPTLNNALVAIETLRKFLLFNPEFQNINQEIALGQMKHVMFSAYMKRKCNKV